MNYYTLYVGQNCNQCENVLDYIQRKELDVLVINVDEEGDSPPVPVFIYPVLFNHQTLVAYGLDIIEHFQANKSGR